MSNDSEAPNAVIRVEFHCHTFASHDAVTTESELVAACIARNINVVTITEHDVFVARAFAELNAARVHVVHGCEFTCAKGSHMIGLFLERHLDLSGRSPAAIVKGIRDAGGIVYMPHPFKPSSGYFKHYEPSQLLDQVDMIELYNGGFTLDPNIEEIRALAAKYDIRLVAGSDSHAAGQVGYYLSEYESSTTNDLRHVFRTQDARLLIDVSRTKPPRELNWIQRHEGYQWLIQRIPRGVKRPLKAMYLRSLAALRTPNSVIYREIA